MTDKVLCPWCEKEMRPYPHQGYYWYQCECGARSPTLWHATQEQTKAKAISYTQELNRLKTENECYSHNIKKLTAENMQLQAEIERLSDLLKRNKRHTDRIRSITAETAKKIKFEAIKEFAKKLRQKFPIKPMGYSGIGSMYSADGIRSHIDNLVKEMVGE